MLINFMLFLIDAYLISLCVTRYTADPIWKKASV